jgi:hypothetical protein
MRRIRIRPRIDPGQRERQRRQREREAAADMAGAEQVKLRRIGAEALDDAAVGQARAAHGAGGDVRVIGETALGAAGGGPRHGDNRAVTFGLGEHGDLCRVGAVEALEHE